MNAATAVGIAIGLWFAMGWYMNLQLTKIHAKLDKLFDQFNGLREYLYEIDPQFDEERRLTRGLFESVEGGKPSFAGMHLNELMRDKRERGERTLNTGFGSDSPF
jgi:hypothetical protein